MDLIATPIQDIKYGNELEVASNRQEITVYGFEQELDKHPDGLVTG